MQSLRASAALESSSGCIWAAPPKPLLNPVLRLVAPCEDGGGRRVETMAHTVPPFTDIWNEVHVEMHVIYEDEAKTRPKMVTLSNPYFDYNLTDQELLDMPFINELEESVVPLDKQELGLVAFRGDVLRLQCSSWPADEEHPQRSYKEYKTDDTGYFTVQQLCNIVEAHEDATLRACLSHSNRFLTTHDPGDGPTLVWSFDCFSLSEEDPGVFRVYWEPLPND